MFYSHTFLARKSPLGTVWIAAHLERRIKKTQVEGIDVPSYAECIMFPEVPIALRLSGHLLLGLVRIYSWKVNYVFQDCNRMLTDIRTMVASVQVNLPEDADHAPFESVTLPSTFELDALELDETYYQIDGPDNHLRTYEEITLPDQVPAEGDPYVAFFINEDDGVDPSPQGMRSNFGAQSMEEDVLPPMEGDFEAIATPIENVMGVGNPAPSNQAEGLSKSLSEGHISLEVPEIEVMRDAVHNFEPLNMLELVDTGNDIGLHEHSIPTNRKGSLSPIMEAASVSGGLQPSPLGDRPHIASLDDPVAANTSVSLGQPLPDLELLPSPLIEKQKPKKRKRKQFFDESIVLSNADMKKQLEDTSKLVCKRRQLPQSNVDVWRFQNNLQKEHILHKPLLSGMSSNLQEVFERTFPLSNIESAALEASHGLSYAQPCDITLDIDMEPEQPRYDSHVDVNVPDIVPSPSGREELTPLETSNLGSVSHIGKTVESETLPTFEITTPAEQVWREPETPFPHLEEQQHPNDTDLPEIPGLLSSADGEGLDFLEASNTSSDCEGVNLDNMSARTRAVAQYLKGHSPATHVSNDQSGNLSLNRILEGKTRKQCARMYYETLVLKSYGFINVQQEEAYGDILISPTPLLSTAKF